MTQTGTPVLRAEHIAKSFDTDAGTGKLEILKDIELSVALSEIVAIVGSSGCGKSTLLHILGGLDRPNSGDVYWEGDSVYSLKPDKLADFRNNSVGFVFQFHHLLPEFTAIENVMMPAFIKGIGQKTAEKKASALLERFGLGSRLTHRPSQLSGGEQQRVSMARALMNDPSIILADEPTGNLDETNTELILSMLFELRKDRDLSIVLITHEEEIASRCDSLYTLQSGVLTKNELSADLS
ncbi:ABC transporter ATP-binding protein [Rhodohalobacter sp. SW132]|uniref:ABC transporter ATP-binding protein n=1 Tax=Rhodohalobacter sp. SW132 TaxID=2293433 RepID=UPI000E22430C|nr:ABC transporter ATP-binding protein [Rhodohalobacter sp. SW132]REL37967.1 ABC transporter ATP-binding protein [Rhodohalobacter sp. SW132]